MDKTPKTRKNGGGQATHTPLAERMRPQGFDRVYGQDHILGPGKLLAELVESNRLVSIIFWGPPGSGKTTLGTMLARHFDLPFEFFSAVLSGIKEVKEFMARAEQQKKLFGKPMILFIDEIHRFNKAQQAAFLPYVEKGDIVLFGSTTENPSFEVIAPLLSRTRVLVLKELDHDALARIIRDALEDKERGLGASGLDIDPAARDMLVDYANGDARRALNTLEIAAGLARGGIISVENVQEALQKRTLFYDKSGEEHFNLISALHKSLRNSDVDAALYWLARMLASGEDPLYVARRMVRFASEDVGLADPQALAVTLQAKEAYDFLGSPEGELALAQAAIYLAAAPKSNRIYTAYGAVQREVERSPHEPVPLQIRNAVTALMKEIGYGQDYLYAHDSPAATTDMETMPERLRGRKYYEPGNLGFEKEIRKRIEWWEALKARIREGRKPGGEGEKAGGA
ncbi:MAG TPA: replication-associated recombination protein A [Candidatus Aminicenantes bacterium]|nr:replication-associated recombination protein A [Candidatus Aminicenantes bacterium]HRY65966.1 replication-associated recombination protein A [Candidatus Aminicenantes bacterium]HRZ72985.1 replication-associated recombination protein A [Candidatus Aminicenantes bacterium]